MGKVKHLSHVSDKTVEKNKQENVFDQSMDEHKMGFCSEQHARVIFLVIDVLSWRR